MEKGVLNGRLYEMVDIFGVISRLRCPSLWYATMCEIFLYFKIENILGVKNATMNKECIIYRRMSELLRELNMVRSRIAR